MAFGVTQLHVCQELGLMDSVILLTKSMGTGLGSQCIQSSESLQEWINGKDEKESTAWSQIIQTLNLLHQVLSKIKQFLRSLPKELFQVSPFWSCNSFINTIHFKLTQFNSGIWKELATLIICSVWWLLMMEISKVKCFSIQSAECYYFLTGLHQNTSWRNWLRLDQKGTVSFFKAVF